MAEVVMIPAGDFLHSSRFSFHCNIVGVFVYHAVAPCGSLAPRLSEDAQNALVLSPMMTWEAGLRSDLGTKITT